MTVHLRVTTGCYPHLSAPQGIPHLYMKLYTLLSGPVILQVRCHSDVHCEGTEGTGTVFFHFSNNNKWSQ